MQANRPIVAVALSLVAMVGSDQSCEAKVQYTGVNLSGAEFGAAPTISLQGKTLGIVGLGNIGQEVARKAKAFDMRVVSATVDFNEQFVRQHDIRLVSLDELLRESDFVSLHVRLNEETRGMISARELSLMKPSAYLINTARYELMDDVALTEAVLQKRLGGIAIDDPPTEALKRLMHLPNAVFTPHLGNRALEGVVEVFRSAVLSASDLVFGRQPKFIVNPDVYESPLRRKSPFMEEGG